MTRELYYSLGSTKEEALNKLDNEEDICGNTIRIDSDCLWYRLNHYVYREVYSFTELQIKIKEFIEEEDTDGLIVLCSLLSHAYKYGTDLEKFVAFSYT